MAIEDCNKKTSALNLLGQRFGQLTVVGRAENTKAAKTRWHCICDCGVASVVVGAKLKNGITISCGCAQRRAITNLGRIRFDDLSGQRFSRLLVIERSVDGKDGKPMFLCRCDCGNKSIVKSQNLRGGTTTSCGCYVREISAARLVKHGLSRTPEYLRQKRARRYRRRRNDPLELSKMRIRDLIRKSIAAKGFRKNCPTHEILGCSYDELRSHIERQFSKGMSWERIGEIHIDHIIPMASANSIEDVYRLNHHTNLRPMWSKDNIKKGASREFLI